MQSEQNKTRVYTTLLAQIKTFDSMRIKVIQKTFLTYMNQKKRCDIDEPSSFLEIAKGERHYCMHSKCKLKPNNDKRDLTKLRKSENNKNVKAVFLFFSSARSPAHMTRL